MYCGTAEPSASVSWNGEANSYAVRSLLDEYAGER